MAIPWRPSSGRGLWPAGQGGLTGYFYDRESGEFAVRHLKNTIKVLSEIEEVERIHIIAHSRGTDVTLTALREIFLPMKECGKDYKDLKLHNLILAAADLDLQVAQQRVVAEEMFRLPKRFTIYTNTKDKAIGISEWLSPYFQRVYEILIFAPCGLTIYPFPTEVVQYRIARSILTTGIAPFCDNSQS